MFRVRNPRGCDQQRVCQIRAEFRSQNGPKVCLLNPFQFWKDAKTLQKSGRYRIRICDLLDVKVAFYSQTP